MDTDGRFISKFGYRLSTFTGTVHLDENAVYYKDKKLAEIISTHAPGARQLSLRIRFLANGLIYRGAMRRRNGPSRVTFKLEKKLDKHDRT